MTAELTFDEAKAGAFAERAVSILNDACLALQISIGADTGLFETMSTLPASTSAEIAEAAGLNERYVREWLNALATGRIVDYDPETRTYSLAPEHAFFLTEAGGSNNLANTMQFIPMLAKVDDQVVECFRAGGGVHYTAYPKFHEKMARESALVHDASLIDTILPLVDGMPDRLEAGIDVLDVGCGRGHAVNLIARAYPASRVAGYDLSEEAVTSGAAEAREWGLTNTRHEARDVTDLDEESAYDLITAFDAIHDQAQPTKVLANIARALRPGGVFLMVDIKAATNVEDNFELPWAPFLYTVSTLHCMTVSLAMDGEGLGTAWGEQKALEMLERAGFTSVEVKSIDGDLFNSYYVARR